MTRYNQAFEEMVTQHKTEFENFKKLKYEDPKFHEVGKQVLKIVEDTERKLCGKMETGGKGTFSANLAEKFRAKVREYLPLLDFVGVQIT